MLTDKIINKPLNYELDGIDTKDYPDFVDAYISYAEHENGALLHELVWSHLF